MMDRRAFVASSAAVAAAASPLGCCRAEPRAPVAATPTLDLEDITLAQLGDGFASGQYTSTAITQHYLDRIAAIDHSGPSVNSVIEVNPEALAHAARLDAERK